ncbi:hypothetical protein D3C76_675230 [compost metagenome]
MTGWVNRDLQLGQGFAPQLFQFIGAFCRLRRVGMALAYLRGLFFKATDLFILAVKQRIATDFCQLQGQLRILFADLEQFQLQVPATGEALQAAANAGPVN